MDAAVTLFQTPRPLTDYLDEDGTAIPGHEASGTMLPYVALDAIARSRSRREPCQLVVTGEERYADGRRFVILSVAADWLVRFTNLRCIDGQWVYVCPDCELTGHRHRRSCPSH
jgi:hypothetical protein